MRHHHLSDHDLVLALDGELPVRRQAAVDAHLTECTSCRTRWAQLGQGAELATAVYRSTLLNAEAITGSRETLRSRLADIARQQDVTFIERFVPPFAQPSRWAIVGVAALAVVLLVRVAQQSESRHHRGTGAAIENGALPVASLTPGATWNLTVNELCAPAGHEQRQVSSAIRVEVLRGYGMERVPADEYELDYLITPELGGAPTAQNLWPQRYASRTWNAHVKDQLERLLPKLVCDGAISLQTAQQDIAVDWIAAYKKYFRTDAPLSARADLEHSLTPDSVNDELVYPIWRSGQAPALRLVSFAVRR